MNNGPAGQLAEEFWAGNTVFGHLAEQYQALLTGSISTPEDS